MNNFKLIAAVAAFGVFATPAIAQTTNTMNHTTNGSMMQGSRDKDMSGKGMSGKAHSMPMNHKGMSKKTIAACHKMSHDRMMKARQCRGMMKHDKTMKHAM